MDQNSGDMSMTMPVTMAPTTTSAAPSSSTTGMDMDVGGMSMGGGGSASTCQISMLWNWNTIDSCFISSSWQIKSNGMFAGSCIGVILLVMCLELLRRAVKEYDRYLIQKRTNTSGQGPEPTTSTAVDSGKDSPMTSFSPAASLSSPSGFRPTLLEQAVRALLHMLQFAVAYFVMLLAMYYNGYFIICIFIGAYLGAFVFQWETIGGSSTPTSAAREATVCCG